MAFDNRLFTPGRFTTIRTVATTAADSATINDTNFPPTSGFSATGSRSVWLCWHGTGGATGDTITVVPFVRDGILNVWNLLPSIVLTKDVMTEVFLYNAALFYIRVNTVSATTATAFTITAAIADADRVQ